VAKGGQDFELSLPTTFKGTPMNRLQILKGAVLAAALAVTVGCSSTPTQEGTGEYLDDTWITTRVKAAMFNESTLRSTEINVETFKGEVQLSGFVNSAQDIRRAVELARSTQGVKSVKNDMRIKGQ
jgi:osmotically-inducible protein OsmY